MGNFLNKEWINIDDDDEFETKPEVLADTASCDSPLIDTSNNLNRRKSSKTCLDKKSDSFESDVKTPITNKTKMVIADFDPRSPSSDIVRTPIFYTSENGNNQNSGDNQTAAKPSFVNKAMINDPRSPTNEYNRTPIHYGANQTAAVEANHEDFVNESSSSLDSSSLLGSDVSGLYQTVPEGHNQPSNSNQESSPSFFGAKFANSNMPRHILQRKQVEKLNKKKLTDLDKENA